MDHADCSQRIDQPAAETARPASVRVGRRVRKRRGRQPPRAEIGARKPRTALRAIGTAPHPGAGFSRIGTIAAQRVPLARRAKPIHRRNRDAVGIDAADGTHASLSRTAEVAVEAAQFLRAARLRSEQDFARSCMRRLTARFAIPSRLDSLLVHFPAGKVYSPSTWTVAVPSSLKVPV